MLTDLIQHLVACGHSAPSADNVQPWHFVWDGQYLSIRYDAERVQHLSFPPESPASFLSFGGVIENISQAAEYSRVPLDINVAQSCLGTSGPEVEIKVPDIEWVEDRENQLPLFGRHTNRFGFKGDPIPSTVLKNLSGLSVGNARIAIFDQKCDIEEIASYVRLASRIRFQTQEVHEWLAKSLRFTKEDARKGDGLDVGTLALPPGGKQFLRFTRDWGRMNRLNKLGIFRLLARADSKPIGQAPAIVSFIAPANPKSALDTGILLSRAWIYLNSQGIAVHPYYVVADQLIRLSNNQVPKHLIGQVEAIKAGSERTFELDTGETLHMLLRIGYPTREPPKSLRLPLDVVFNDISK